MDTLLSLGSSPALSDCSVVRTRSYKLAKRHIAQWHSTLPIAPPGFRVAFLLINDKTQEILGVATWGRPTARLLDQHTVLELTRLAVGPRAPRNACSWMMARMRKWIRDEIPQIELLVSYQDCDVHSGGIYKADNWRKAYQKRISDSWTNRPGRAGTERKHRARWERSP